MLDLEKIRIDPIDMTKMLDGFGLVRTSLAAIMLDLEKIRVDFESESYIAGMVQRFGMMHNSIAGISADLQQIRSVENTLDSIRSEFSQSSNPMENMTGVAFKNPDPYLGSISSLINESFKKNETTETVKTVAPILTTEELNNRTVKYYDESLLRMNMMIAALERANYVLDKTRDEATSNSDKIATAIYRSGPTV